MSESEVRLASLSRAPGPRQDIELGIINMRVYMATTKTPESGLYTPLTFLRLLRRTRD